MSDSWTPNGSHLIFVSDRSASQAFWAVPLQDGKAVGEPVLLDVAGPTGTPMRVAADGTLYYSRGVGGGPTTFVIPP